MPFKSTGTLIYDPHLADQKRMKPYWLILSCDEGVSRYYAWLLLRERCVKLGSKCLWGSHISVVRGEQPKEGWWGKAGVGETIEFSYEPVVFGDGTYFWLEIECPRMSEIRGYYGLSPKPYFNFHLTIGNTLGA